MNNFSKVVLGSVAAVAVSASAAFATIPAQTNCSYYFANNMKLGMRSVDVMNLQKVLNMDVRTQIAASGVGSAGQETMYFGPATFAAVKKFQSLNGVSPVSGYAATLTRGVLNQICTTTGSTSTTTNSNVSSNNIMSNNIPVGVLVAGQASAKLAEFVVNTNGTVTGLELMRTGVSNNTTLENVYLYDGLARVAGPASVLTDGTIRFINSAGMFTVNTSKTLTVRADIAGGTSGQTVGVAMKNITMMGSTTSPVGGVTGPLFSVASANMATAYTGAVVSAASPVNAGTLNSLVWSYPVNIGQRAVNFKGATFKMIGSAPANSLSNVRLNVDGVTVATGMVDAAGMITFTPTSSSVWNVGSRNVEVRADIVNGSNRTFYVVLENAADILLEDTTLPGANVSVKVGSTSGPTISYLQGGTVNINQGSLILTVKNATSTNIVGGTTNTVIGSYTAQAFGEDMKVNNMSVTISQPTVMAPAGTGLNNVALYVNGAQVGTAQSITGALPQTVNFTGLGSSFILSAGQTATVEVKADLFANNTNVAYTTGSVKTDIVAGTSNAQGISSSALYSTNSSSGQTLTLSTSNINFARSSGFVAQSVQPNSADVKIGSFVLQTGATEGANISEFKVALTYGGGMTYTNVTNLTIKDGATIVGTPVGGVSAAGTDTFGVSLSVPANSTKTYDVYANLGGSAGSVQADMGTTYRGSVSNTTTTETPASNPGVLTTVGTSNMAAANVTVNSPTVDEVSQYVVGGVMKRMVTYKFVSPNNIPAQVTRMKFLVGGAPNGIQNVKVAGVTAPVDPVTGIADATSLALSVPGTAAGVTVPVEVTYSCFVGGNVGSGCNLTNALVTPEDITLSLTDVEANSGGTTITGLTGLAGKISQTMKLVASKPTFTVAASPVAASMVNGNNVVAKFTVTADAGGPIELKKLAYTLSASGATLGAAPVDVRANGASILSLVPGPTNTGFVFTNAYTLAAGDSVTFEVISPVTVSGTNQSVVSSLNAAMMEWKDVLGGSAANLDANLIQNFPTNTYSIRN